MRTAASTVAKYHRVGGVGVFAKLHSSRAGERVPATEAQGRIHTSACTVAILPELDEVEEIALNPADLRVDTYRSSGAGGQHVNKTDSPSGSPIFRPESSSSARTAITARNARGPWHC